MSYVGIGNRQDYIADFPTQSFNGDGSTTTFTLNFEAVTGSVRVAVDNVLQPADGTSYYTNGNSITFTSAPATGTANITVTYLGTVRNVSSVSDGAITTAKLADGAVTNVKLANSSITVNGTAIDLGSSGTISAGISQTDEWALTSNFTGDAEPITSNLSRMTSARSYIGDGMTQSSGVFTFPVTGQWLIIFSACGYATTSTDFWLPKIERTTNNSTYSELAIGDTMINHQGSFDNYCSGTAISTFDVTDTTQCKVRFAITDESNSTTTRSNSATARTSMLFIRLGDT